MAGVVQGSSGRLLAARTQLRGAAADSEPPCVTGSSPAEACAACPHAWAPPRRWLQAAALSQDPAEAGHWAGGPAGGRAASRAEEAAQPAFLTQAAGWAVRLPRRQASSCSGDDLAGCPANNCCLGGLRTASAAGLPAGRKQAVAAGRLRQPDARLTCTWAQARCGGRAVALPGPPAGRALWPKEPSAGLSWAAALPAQRCRRAPAPRVGSTAHTGLTPWANSGCLTQLSRLSPPA